MMRFAVLLTLFAALGTTGCTIQDTAINPQQRVITGGSADEVLAAATLLLRDEFGAARPDYSHYVVTTPWQEYTTQRDSGTARDFYGGESTLRRRATLKLLPRTQGPIARLQIDIERRDTAARNAIPASSSRISDLPGHETAIDRDAATTRQQNTVWTRVRRDTSLERALLKELQARFGPGMVEPSPADRVVPTPDAPEPSDDARD